MRICPKGVTPECFNRGPVPVSPGFPIEAFGNDELLETRNSLHAASCGEASAQYKNGRHLLKEKLLKKIAPWLLLVEEDFGTDIVHLGKFSASGL
jgi:hypothetical protein